MTRHWQITFDLNAPNPKMPFGYRVGSKRYGFLGLTLNWYHYSYDHYSSYKEVYDWLISNFIPSNYQEDQNIFHRGIANVKSFENKSKPCQQLIEFVD